MINAINNSPNFKAVYYEKSYLNKSQKRMAFKIISEFRTPVLNQKHGYTYEILYENRGYDFVIKPDGYEDKVSLFGCKKLENDSRGDYFYIGSYDCKKPFQIQDVENGIQSEKTDKRFFGLALLAIVTAFIFMPIKGCMNALRGENSGKESSAITDTIKKSTNTIKRNILDLAKNLK